MITVAVLGLGSMGLPMARHLARDFTVRAFDVNPDRRELAGEVGTVAASAREAVAGAAIVVVAVVNQEQFEGLLWGDGGIAEAMAPGATVLLTSTVGIDPVRLTAERLAERGLRLVDAPVSGVPVRAGNGDLLVAVGADDAAWAAAEPVLDALASTLVRVGPRPGDGQAMKTVNQLLCGVHIAAAAKAASMMFPPIEMPPDLPEVPTAPVLKPASATVPVPAAVAAPSPAPAKVQPPPVSPPRRPAKRAPGALDFEPTRVELPPGEQSGFADTQPQVEADPLQVCTVREVAAPVPGHPAVEWLRERPVALLGVLVLGIALVALAPLALRVFHVATQSKAPVIEDLHPTYVEPTPAPAATAPPEIPGVAAEASASEPVAPVAAVADTTEPPKAARSPKRAVTSKPKVAVARKAPETEAPARAPEPAPAPPVLDPGGHSGFAPKCRWVTPTKWSCE